MMIPIPLPFVLVLAGALYWPVTLTIAIALAGLGAFVPRLWVRIVCFGLAGVLVADCLLALPFGRE